MRDEVYLTNEGKNIKFTTRADIGKLMLLGQAYILNNNIKNFRGLLVERRRLSIKLKDLEKKFVDRYEDVYLLSVDVYYYLKIKKCQRKLKTVDTMIKAYEFICGADIDDMKSADYRQVRTTAYSATSIGETYTIEDIFNNPIDVNIFDINPKFIDAFTTFLFNRNTDQSLMVDEYIKLEKDTMEKTRKNRRK